MHTPKRIMTQRLWNMGTQRQWNKIEKSIKFAMKTQNLSFNNKASTMMKSYDKEEVESK